MKFCKGCKSTRSAKFFGDDARTRDGKATTCVDCSKGTRSFAELEVEDVNAVEVMAADETVHGVGSAPEGDTYSEAELEEIAGNTNAVIDRLKPFVKLGHSSEQALAKASGLYDDAENPATGFPQNFRCNEDGKMLADFKAVPKKLATLMRSGAFRFRSSELRSFEGKPVIKAVALLGAKAPAFKTLNDIYALYQDDADAEPFVKVFEADQPLDEDGVTARDYAVGDVVWDPELAASDVMGDLTSALNPEPPSPAGFETVSEYRPKRYWCNDVMIEGDGGKALVSDYTLDDYTLSWIVPFTFNAEHEPVPAGTDEWVLAQQAWIERSKTADAEYAETATNQKPGRDTTVVPENKNKPVETEETPVVPDTKAFTEALGLAEDASADDITAKIDELKTAADKPAAVEVEGRAYTEDEIKGLTIAAERGSKAYEELQVMRKDRVRDDAFRDGRLTPAEWEEKWEKRYDDSPAVMAGVIADLRPDPTLTTGANGVDGGESDYVAYSDADEDLYLAYCEANGIDYIGPRRPDRNREETA